MAEARVAARAAAIILLGSSTFLGLSATSASAVSAQEARPSAVNGQGSAPVTFGIQTASELGSQITPDDRPYFSFGVAPGAVISDHVSVTNYSARALRLHVYSTDSVITNDGGFALRSANQASTDVGSWVTLDGDGMVTVPARSVSPAGTQVPGRIALPVTLTVPDGASPGDHVGGIVASLDSSGVDAGGATVQLDQRVAIRMFVRVDGPLHPALTISGLHIQYRGGSNPLATGTAVISYRVRNSGNVELAGRQSVTVMGPFGKFARTLTAPALPALLPGAELDVSVQVPSVRGLGSLSAAVRLVPQFFGAETGPQLHDATANSRITLMPWTLLAAVGLVVALVALAVFRRRRRTGSGRHKRSRHRAANRPGPPSRRHAAPVSSAATRRNPTKEATS